jgi:hypothetical protein
VTHDDAATGAHEEAGKVKTIEVREVDGAVERIVHVLVDHLVCVDMWYMPYNTASVNTPGERAMLRLKDGITIQTNETVAEVLDKLHRIDA